MPIRMTLDPSHVTDLENMIEVDFTRVVTLPVIINGEPTGLAVYIGETRLGAANFKASDGQILLTAARIAEAFQK